MTIDIANKDYWNINDYADFWRDIIGANVIPADTKNKVTIIKWSEYQDKPISQEQHDEWKRTGAFEKGIAVILGKLWHSKEKEYQNKVLVGIDIDNKKGIEEFVRSGLELKQKTLVEQHVDPTRMHIYFIVDNEIPNKTSDKVDIHILEKLDQNLLPALEVKSNGKGIMFCTPSPHKNGSKYHILGTLKPAVFNAQDLKNRISLIC